MPLYFQLAAALTEKLEAGTWSSGARFATEREIAEEFDVSRSVIRRALDLLVGDGAIARKQGAGAFVRAPRHSVPVCGLLKALSDPPENLSLTILTAGEEVPDAALARLLNMGECTSPVAHVTAVWKNDGVSVGLIDSYSLAAFAPWVLPTAEALLKGIDPPKLLKLELRRAKVPIELTFFGDWGGPQVGVAAGDPAFKGTLVQFARVSEPGRERPIEVAHLVYRSDNAQLALELD